MGIRIVIMNKGNISLKIKKKKKTNQMIIQLIKLKITNSIALIKDVIILINPNNN